MTSMGQATVRRLSAESSRLPLGCGVFAGVYAAASLLWSQGDPVTSGVYLATWGAVFVAGMEFDVRRVYQAFLWFMVLNIGLLFVDELHVGLFGNRNFMACALVMGIAIAFSLRNLALLFVPLAFFGLVWLESRGAMLAAGVVASIWLFPRFKVLSFCAVVIGFVIAMTWTNDPIADRLGSITVRIGVWHDVVNHFVPWGIGFGSFFDTYFSWPFHVGPMFPRPTHVYNDFLELTLELGLAVTALWVFIAGGFSKDNWLILLTFILLGLTYFPLYVLPCGHLFFLALGSGYNRRLRWPDGN